jgi:hypothetical protein
MSIDYEEEGFKFARRRFEDGKKQGALEELEKLGRFIDDWYSAIDGERLTEYYAKRLKEMKGV